MHDGDDLLERDSPEIYQIQTSVPGPEGRLPLTEELLRHAPSGDLFGLTQNVGMGWNSADAARKQFLILSTQGGVRAPDGKPIALGYHTGHWEIGLLVQAAVQKLFASSAPYLSPVSVRIPVMAVPRAPSECSIAFLIATMPPPCFVAWRARSP